MKKNFLLLVMMCLLGGFSSSLMAQETVTIDGTVGGYATNSSNNVPFNTNYKYSTSQQIYLADELGMTNGDIITNVAFYVKTKNMTLTRTIKIYMVNTELVRLPLNATNKFIQMSDADLVYDGNITIDANSKWYELDLDTDFTYTGNSVLLCVYDYTGVDTGKNTTFNTYNSKVTDSEGNFIIRGVYKYSASAYDPTIASNCTISMTAGGNYMPQIKFTYSSGGSAETPAPTAPTLNYPSNNQENVFNPYLRFTLGSNTTHYQILMGTGTGEMTALTDWVGKTVEVVDFQTSNLQPATTYVWKVVAKNDKNDDPKETSSDVYSFTTKQFSSPGEIENAYPNGDQNLVNPEFTWTFGDDTEEYQVIIDGEAKTEWTNPGSATTGSYQTSGLSSGEHTWRIDARNTVGTTTGTEYTFSITSVPDNVTPVSPTDGATGVTSNIVTFKFAPNTTHYKLMMSDTNVGQMFYFSQENGGTGNNWTSTNGIDEMSFAMPYFTTGKTFYWAVEVKNAVGERTINGTEKATIYSFTAASTLPVTYDYPANGAIASEVNPALSWKYVGNAAYYQVLFGESKETLSIKQDWTPRGEGEKDQYQTSDLKATSEYYWQVNVRETETSEILYGDIVSFITKLEVPQNVSANPEEVEPTLGEYGSTQIMWNSIRGATSYNVYLDGVKLNSTTTNSYTVEDRDFKIKSNMDPGYNFTVTALYEGYGESGVSEAVNVKVANVGMLIVYIKDPNNNPIEGASIELSGISEFGKEKTYTIHSDTTGKGSQSILVADYAMTISKDNYSSYSYNSVKIEKNKEKILDVTLASEYIYNVTAKETETNGNIEITLTNKEIGYYDIYLKTNESESLKIVDGAFFSLNGTSAKYEYKYWNTLANGTYQFGVANFNSDIINWSNEITRDYAIFNTDGDWNTASNWKTGLPQEDEKVLIYANATIAAADVITAKNVEIKTGGSLTIDGSLTADMVVNGEEEALCINDGGQLRQGNTKLKGKFVMDIKGGNWTENKDRTGWQFISSPVTDALISQFIPAEGDYDLYKYDGSKEAEWVNYKSTGDDSGNNPGNDPNQPDDNDITSSFSFDFEDGTMNGWRKYEGDGATGGGWQVTADDESFYLGYNDSKGIYSISYDSDLWIEYIPLNYIVTTKAYKITETSELSWFMRPTDAMYCENDKYQVIASRDGVNFDIILGSYGGNSNNYNSISLKDYADQELYFGFYHYSDGDLCDAIVLDNIILKTESKTRNMRSFEEEKFESGRAYLASYETATTATFKGTLNNATSHTYTVSYTEDKPLANFHLLGNPFTFDMDWSKVALENVYPAFATVNPLTGGYVNSIESGVTTIPVGDGFFVEAKGKNPSISYNAGSKSRGEKVEYINVIASGKQGSNNVIIKLAGKEEKGFSKLENLNQSIADLYVKNNGKRYSVLGYDRNVTEIELFFDAKEMGNYSISIEPNGKFQSVTLVDRMTGIETNMLLDSYTFTATANDNPNRFVLKLANGQEPTANSNFVYQSGEELIVEAEGTIQIIDVMGRMVYNNDVESSNNRINVSNLKGATYIVRNITDNDVKVQKVVIY